MQSPANSEVKKFGTFLGVFLPSLLTVLGLILFLRFGWVLGNLGLGLTLVAVILAHSITFITGLSASSIATNMDMGAGGAYFLVSRSLGIETGGAIGVAFYISRTLSLTFYAFGFVEAVLLFWPASWGPIPPYAPPLITAAVILIVSGLAIKSAELVLKIQFPMLILVGIAFCALIWGVFSHELHMPEWQPTYRSEPGGFWVVFAVFFPGVTGFMAGMAMSGDLKDPATSIPRGTIGSILTSALIYILVPTLLSITVLVSATQMADPEFGIQSWTKVALFGGILIYPAVLGAILSAAFSSVLSGPRGLQSLANDGLAPKIFAKTSKTGEPTVATWVTAAIALVAVALGDLNTVARFVTVLFLTLYVVINLVAAIEKFVAEPSYRPRINVPWQLSLGGALLGLIVIYYISPTALLLAVGLEAGCYIYFRRKLLEQQWGDVNAGFWMQIARFALLRMNNRMISSRNWRPLILVFVKDIPSRIELVKLAAAFGQNKGVLSIARLISSKDKKTIENVHLLQPQMNQALKPYRLEAFCEIDIVDSLHEGILSISKGHGIAGLKTNTIMFGWSGIKESNVNQLKIIRDLGVSGKNIILAKFNDHEAWKEKNHKRIHIWWGGRQTNGDLLLILAYMLKLNEEWKRAEILIQAAVDTPEDQLLLQRGIQYSIKKSRIPATVTVHQKGDSGFRALLKEKSGNADIVFLGLKHTEIGEEESHTEILEEMGQVAQTVIFVQNNSMKDALPVLLR